MARRRLVNESLTIIRTFSTTSRNIFYPRNVTTSRVGSNNLISSDVRLALITCSAVKCAVAFILAADRENERTEGVGGRANTRRPVGPCRRCQIASLRDRRAAPVRNYPEARSLVPLIPVPGLCIHETAPCTTRGTRTDGSAFERRCANLETGPSEFACGSFSSRMDPCPLKGSEGRCRMRITTQGGLGKVRDVLRRYRKEVDRLPSS